MRENRPLFHFTWSGKAVGVNARYVGRTKKRLSPGYKQFKRDIAVTLLAGRFPHTDEKLHLRIDMYVGPQRDSDNLIKPLFDGIQLSNVIANDRQIRSYTVDCKHKAKGEMDTIIVHAYKYGSNL